MINRLRVYFCNIVKKIWYWLPVCSCIVISYGFSVVNPSLSIDDLARYLYIGSGQKMLAATRWGMYIFTALFSTWEYSPFIDKLFSVFFYLCGTILISCIFFSIDNDDEKVNDADTEGYKYTIFTVMMVSFPLFTNIFEYSIANVAVGAGVLITAISLLQLFVVQKKFFQWKSFFWISALLTLSVSSYEVGAFFYVSMTFIILFYLVIANRINSFKQWLFFGLRCVPPLIMSILSRYVIGFSLIKALNISYSPNGETLIWWGTEEFVIIDQIKKFFNDYFLFSIENFAIAIFDFCLLLFIVFFFIKTFSNSNIVKEGAYKNDARKKVYLLIVSFICVIFSLFLQTIFQGMSSPYRNSAVILAAFVAFISYLYVSNKTFVNRKIKKVMIIIISIIVLRQSINMHSTLSTNILRSQNETSVVRNLGITIKRDYINKPIIFVGQYNMGNWIYEEEFVKCGGMYYKAFDYLNLNWKYYLCKKNPTNVNSLLNWSMQAFDNQIMMKEYFSYCGFDIDIIEDNFWEKYQEAILVAQVNKITPFSILDYGDFLIVCLGEV